MDSKSKDRSPKIFESYGHPITRAQVVQQIIAIFDVGADDPWCFGPLPLAPRWMRFGRAQE
jgi:hypothetical protein